MEELNISKLNDPCPLIRLSEIERIASLFKEKNYQVLKTKEVNNHIHTIYSFSPYSPSMAAYLAWQAGLQTAGIMDHDSVAGCPEFVSACKRLGINSTQGFELRANFSGTKVEEKKLNNPDSKNIGYLAIHGIPERRWKEVEKFLKPIQQMRNGRNKEMVEKLNHLIENWGIEKIDFYPDVYAISQAKEGGSITERHLLYALAKKILQKTGKGEGLLSFLQDNLKVDLSEKLTIFLLNQGNLHYIYDLIGVLKSNFLDQIYIQPNNQECISVFDAVKFANDINAIPAYAYLGDVISSPTGDKKAEKFEDDFLDQLIPEIKSLGFKSVTYMPPRNTFAQLQRLQRICRKYDLMEISGVDINSSRQSFHCPIILKPEFSNLVETTWALIAHQELANHNEKYALFNNCNPLLKGKSLREKIKIYAEMGRKIDANNPGKTIEKLSFSL